MAPRKKKSQSLPRGKVDGYAKKPSHVPKKAAAAANNRASQKPPYVADEEQQPNPYPIQLANPRYKRPFKITRGSLWREDFKPEDIEELAKNLQQDSSSHATWGHTSQNPIVGNKRKRANRNAVRRGADGQGIMSYIEMRDDLIASTRKPIIPNTLARTPILRVPLEVRERIYGYLLRYPKPILLKSDWATPERNTFVSHAILLTCKQFAHECTSFLYSQNSFQAILRPSTSRQRMYDDTPRLRATLHHLFQHVVLDFAKECWSIDWFEKTAASLQTLVAAHPSLDSLTLVLSPKRVGFSTTALGMQANPIAFADFLWDSGAVMQAICKLCPRRLKVVVKKGTRRFGIEVDMWGLKMLMAGHWEGANEIGVRMAEDRGLMVREELGDLRTRFEEVFEDDGVAVAVGRCHVLGEDESAVKVGHGPLPVQEGVDLDGELAAASQSSDGSEAIALLASLPSSVGSSSASNTEDDGWTF
ncbi:hypothetical protein LOCC1_G005842 [Lachnellula occidentalis]|uniref:F-box domain-containing protein n=1 Tax=Lachnellula occidentalis TaxID=215460 RepID=A0A8H8RSV2_9HELO|nr:hypothetical protein LOCC1_G005842 [Lachnellula occidentalis]